MAVRIVQLGTPRKENEGLRIGTVRRPPRGVPKSEYAKLDFYDVWLPQLAPSAELVKLARHQAQTPAQWLKFERHYTRELASADNLRLIDLLAAFSKATDFSVGCYCEDESRCHRSILKKVLLQRGAIVK